MPLIVFLLMALEATRQIQVLSQAGASVLRVSDLVYSRRLGLDSIPESEDGLEVKLIAVEELSQSRFNFKIGSDEEDTSEGWNCHCTGTFSWSETPITVATSTALGAAYEPSLLSRWEALGNTIPDAIRLLKTCMHGCSGGFEHTLYPHENYENYPIEPGVLIDVLKVTTIPLMGRNAPAIHSLVSIASVDVPIPAEPSALGQFSSDMLSQDPYGARCNIQICQGGRSILLNELQFQATKLLPQEPFLHSLFFKALTMPDISYLDEAAPCLNSLKVVELISHKWPMSDIRIEDLNEKTINVILNAFKVYDVGARPMFRSINIKATKAKNPSNRVYYVEKFTKAERCHVLFTGNTSDSQYVYDSLLPRGLACFPLTRYKTDSSLPTDLFDLLTTTNKKHIARWRIWRKRSEAQSPEGRNVVFFRSLPSEASADGSPLQNLSSYGRMRTFRSLPTTQQKILQYCQNTPTNRFDAIVMDNAEKSLITTWSGDVFMPWMQILLKYAESILWVTDSHFTGPFNNVVGTLLRTLQSEQPSLKVRWLMVPDSRRFDFESRIREAYMSMLEGDNEVKCGFHNDQPSVLRYYPDDELSAATGMISPRKVESPLTRKSYTLSFGAPQKPVILSFKTESRALQDEELRIRVQASVIDPDDVYAFIDDRRRAVQAFTRCKFFAGRIISDKEASSFREQVVGYTTTSHQNVVDVPTSQIYDRAQHPPSPEAACEFAAIAVASCIVDGVARARKGDTFDLQVDGILKVALNQLITSASAIVIKAKNTSDADFKITYESVDGVLVNGKSFDLHRYLQSPRGRDFVEQAWQNRRLLSCPLKAFELPDYAKAFHTASTQAQPYSTAIHHGSDEQTVKHIPIYKPSAALFSSTGHYILVGGLGGLGRFFCTWMVEHGARKLVAVSRSGLSSPQAQETQSKIAALGASLQVFQGDACHRPTMYSILAELRQTASIRGIINLAMILGDAPMATMTGEEWDRALRVKIDSSWILHEETLEDPLDFFILFSSIASVCGNRNQGNYNVGNTFLNALAEYRQSLDRPGISIALGAMSRFFPFREFSPISPARSCPNQSFVF